MANRSEALRVSGGPGKASGAGAEGEWEAETDETVLAAARRDPEEERLGIALRPTSFDEFIGQARAVNNLKIAIEAARRRGEPLRHLLFSGPPGLGKTSLAHLVAKEMGTAFHT
ncbi:MAG: AAA family ATPase, partial [Planctomycetes bacterium]|nr:AAA family ATPase [Planctomycetota bacterium]